MVLPYEPKISPWLQLHLLKRGPVANYKKSRRRRGSEVSKMAEKASKRLTETIWKEEHLVQCGEDLEKVFFLLCSVLSLDTSCDIDVRVSDFSHQLGHR